jgi:hypothetical protein
MYGGDRSNGKKWALKVEWNECAVNDKGSPAHEAYREENQSDMIERRFAELVSGK